MAPRFWLLSRVCRLCPPVWLSQLTTATALLYNAFAVVPPIWGCYRCGHHEGWASKWRLGQTSWCFSSKEQIHWHHVLCVVCGFWFSLHMSIETFWNLQFAAVFLVNCSQSHGVKPTLTHRAWSKQRRIKANGVDRCLSLIFPGNRWYWSPWDAKNQITNNLQQPAASQIHWNLVHQCASWEPWQLLKTLLPAPMVQCLRCCTEPSADCNLLAPGFPCTNSEPPAATGTFSKIFLNPKYCDFSHLEP